MRRISPVSLWLLAFAFNSAAQSITVYPGPASIAKGSTRQMSAYVPLAPNTVTWAVNGVVGGTAAFGIVSATGNYTAPATVPAANQITIKVTSTTYPTKFGTARISITQPQTYVWSSYPSKFAAGAVAFTINGAGFVPGAVITLNNQPLVTTYVSPTSLKVTGSVPASMVGPASLRAMNPAPGATTSDPVTVTITTSAVNVTVTPATAALPLNAAQAFAASVTGSTNTAVTWSASAGAITASGVYTAPATLPNPATAAIRATSKADPLVFAIATITLTQPSVTVTVTPSTAQLFLQGTRQFAAAVTGSASTAVNWAVNGVAGGNTAIGTVSTTGLYTAPTTLPAPAIVSVRATSAATPSAYGQATITLKLTPPALPNLSHARFLEQAAFGPTPAELQNVGQLGINGWLTQQFSMTESPIAVPASNGIAQTQYLSRLVHAPDQLRQRMVNALAKVIVLSAAKNPYPIEVVPYWQILSRNAFGSYRQLLYDITVSPQMGKYLDLANSRKPLPGTAANENYPREVMQLFSTGLVLLNPDGSTKLDGQGKPLPAYTQTAVSQLALALTGWTYPTPVGGAMGVSNWESFNAPSMEPREQYHDQTAKTLIGGCTIPGGLQVVAETNLALDCLFNHPNTAPFIVTRLIRDLVTSNPSPAYIQRVVSVWNDSGSGAKGDLKAVLTAILTDAEARQDQATPQQGRLKDATYHIVAFTRAMNGSLTPDNLRSWNFTQMGQAPLAPPSVFGHYALLYRIPATALAGPEFQIYTPTESMLRGNFIYEMLNAPSQSDLKIDLTPFHAAAGDSAALIEQANATLLYGRMPQAMKDSLAVAVAAAYDNPQRVITALYLTALSGYYTVQY